MCCKTSEGYRVGALGRDVLPFPPCLPDVAPFDARGLFEKNFRSFRDIFYRVIPELSEKRENVVDFKR